MHEGYHTIEVAPIAGALGAEIRGVDLATEVDGPLPGTAGVSILSI